MKQIYRNKKYLIVFLLTFCNLNVLFAFIGYQYPLSSEIINKKITFLFKTLYLKTDLNIFYHLSFSFNFFELILIQNIFISFITIYFLSLINKYYDKVSIPNFFIFTSITLFVFYFFDYSSLVPRLYFIISLFLVLFYGTLVKFKFKNIFICILFLLNIFVLYFLRSSYNFDISVHNYASLSDIEQKLIKIENNYNSIHKDISGTLLSFSSSLSPELQYKDIEFNSAYSAIQIESELYGNIFKSLFFKHPEKNINCLFIHYRGHDTELNLNNLKINKILNMNQQRKCDVLLLDMIGEGFNSVDYIIPTKDGDLSIVLKPNEESHQFLDKFYFTSQNEEIDFISFMTLTQHHITKKIIEQHNYEFINLFGFSGGGWSSLFLAITIPEIDNVIIHSGSIPSELDNYYYITDYGHKEYQSPLFQKYSYFDLYFLISSSKILNDQRSLTLAFSSNDPCCFSDPGASILSKIINQLNIENLNVEVFKNNTHGYDISQVENILFNY